MACPPASSADQEAEHEGAVFPLLSDNLHGAARLQVWSEFLPRGWDLGGR